MIRTCVSRVLLAVAFVLPSIARADTVDLRIDLIGQGITLEPNYEAEFLVDRSPTPAISSTASFTLTSADLTVLSDTIPYAKPYFPIVFSPGNIALDDPFETAPASYSSYDLGFEGILYGQNTSNFYTGSFSDPTFVNGTYTGFGFLGAGYTDHLVISTANSVPSAPTPEPSSVLLTLTGIFTTSLLLARKNAGVL